MKKPKTKLKKFAYLRFAKVELFMEINRLKDHYELSNDELLAIIGDMLFDIGSQDDDEQEA
jgi:hypothetical protein